MSTQPRKSAPRLARPAQRYWKGKAPKGLEQQASSDEDDEEDQEEQQEEVDLQVGVVEEGTARRAGKVAMNVALKDVNVDAGGKVIVGGKEESGRTAMEESESEEESDDDEPQASKPAGGEESGSEYESSSEDDEEEQEEEKPKLMFRPVFVPKRGRVTVLERENDNPESEDAIAKKEKEAERKKQESHDLVAESIKRELAEKETEAVIPDVDDTDGLDPEAEFEEWRLRELLRIKRDKEAKLQREREKEEVERRRAMPEAQRMAEDLEHAKKTRDEKPKGQQKFLQKYWHKGAFHQDDEILKKHDYTEATLSTVDVAMLPKVMQVKDFGKRSRTKYTHLLDQDTTRAEKAAAAGSNGAAGSNSAGCFLCGGPHLKKDCPQNLANGGTGATGVQPGTGANQASGSNGARKWGLGSRQAAAVVEEEERRRKPSWRDRDEDGAPPGPRHRDWRKDERGEGTGRDDRREERRREEEGRRDGRGGEGRRRDDRGEGRRMSPPRGPRGDDRDRTRPNNHHQDDWRRRRSRSKSRERESNRDRDGADKRRRYQ